HSRYADRGPSPSDPPDISSSSFLLAALRSSRRIRGARFERNHTIATVPARYVTAYAIGMLFKRRVVSAAGSARSVIVLLAVPIAVDCVYDPARTPAAVPAS